MKPPLALIVVTVLLGPTGCSRPDRTARVANEPHIALLSEAEFDEFAGRVADSLTAAIASRRPADAEIRELESPAVVRGPIAMHNGAVAARDLDALADALAAGLNDRTSGLAVFRGPSATNAALTAQLLAARAEAGTHVFTLVVRDASDNREHVRESVRVEPRAAASEASSAAAGEKATARRTTASIRPEQLSREKPSGRGRRLSIDSDPRGLLEVIREQAGTSRERTAGSPGAEVLFIDDGASKRHRLLEQRTQRTSDGRLRVEMDFRARQRRGDANLRLIFMDDAGRQIEVTPVLPYRFLADYTTTVAITSVSREAAGYVCLLDD